MAGGGLFVCLGGDPPLFPPSSTFLVRQQRPFPGQVALRSISSHRRVKNPETQVPRHPPLKLPAAFPSLLLLLLFFCSDLFGVCVVRLVVPCVDVGVGAGVV